jgi:hypothetical protein
VLHSPVTRVRAGPCSVERYAKPSSLARSSTYITESPWMKRSVSRFARCRCTRRLPARVRYFSKIVERSPRLTRKPIGRQRVAVLRPIADESTCVRLRATFATSGPRAPLKRTLTRRWPSGEASRHWRGSAAAAGAGAAKPAAIATSSQPIAERSPLLSTWCGNASDPAELPPLTRLSA